MTFNPKENNKVTTYLAIGIIALAVFCIGIGCLTAPTKVSKDRLVDYELAQLSEKIDQIKDHTSVTEKLVPVNVEPHVNNYYEVPTDKKCSVLLGESGHTAVAVCEVK